MSPLGRGIESEGRDVTVSLSPVSEDESYTSRKNKADMVDCTLGFKEPLRLVVLGQEAEREGVGSCGFDAVVGRSASCWG